MQLEACGVFSILDWAVCYSFLGDGSNLELRTNLLQKRESDINLKTHLFQQKENDK